MPSQDSVVIRTIFLKMTARTSCFFLFCILSALLFRHDLSTVAALSWNDDRYTHIILIPFFSLGLIYLERRRTFLDVQFSPWLGLALAVPGAALYYSAKEWSTHLGANGTLPPAVAAIVLGWIAGFLFFYGRRSARIALFPLTLLLLAIPIPPPMVELAEVVLQKGSAEVTHIIFKLTATPMFREEMVFVLPGLTIEVAQECSGIRSSIALLITALVLGHLFLRSSWSRTWCVILSVPIAIFKNAVRIATLSWLGAYLSPDYLDGSLHHSGGPLFSILSLALLLAVLWTLRRREDSVAKRQPSALARINLIQTSRPSSGL